MTIHTYIPYNKLLMNTPKGVSIIRYMAKPIAYDLKIE